MALSLASIAQLSSDVVDTRFPQVSVSGVLPGTGDPTRVELLLTVGRDQLRRRVMFNLSRVDSGAFERELDAKLDFALTERER